MEMPKLNEQHRKLSFFAGRWEGAERLAASPWGPASEAVGKLDARLDIDGFFLIGDYVQEKDGQVTFRGHGIHGWDAATNEVAWYWVDSMGFVPDGPARGGWQGNALALTKSTPRGQARYTYVLLDDRRYAFKIENSFDGGATWQTFLEAEYHRV